MQQASVLFRRCLALALICLSLGVSPTYAVTKIGKANISGQVVDSNGLPIAGVVVKVKGPAPLRVIRKTRTDLGGFYALNGLNTKQKLLVSFKKAGFAPSQGSLNLEQESPSAAKKAVKFQSATLNKMLLTSGTVQQLNPAQGGTLTEKGFKVSFTPDSLTGSADIPVDITISPIDVSSAEAAAAPGDYSARTLDGQQVQLESFSMADFTLSQAGNKVNLKPGATADIELLLPANTPLALGAETAMWHFDMQNGVWQEQGRGQVAQATLNPSRRSVFATVKHFSWWNSDQPLLSTEVTGRVLDAQGLPLNAANVEGFGLDYAGHSYAVPTNGQGRYCIKIKSAARSELLASITLAGINFKSAGMPVTGEQGGNSCANGTAQQVPDIVLPTKLACIEGNVKDQYNKPVAGLTVFTSSGSYASTDANGAFHLSAAEKSSIKVSALGYPIKQVTTADAGAACAVAELRPGTGTGPTCLAGVVYQCNPSNPIPGRVVEARLLNSNLVLGRSQPSTADGSYCIDGLPAAQDVVIDPSPEQPYYNEAWQANTGNAGGTCAQQTCNAGPALDIECY